MNKLLIIDDDPLIRNYLKVLFEEMYEVIIAEDGEQGELYADQYKPRLIISDIQMPKITGMQFVLNLRRQKPPVLTPVVLFSGSIDQKVMDFVQTQKFVYALEKLTPPSEIQETILTIEDETEAKE
jgi:DNA-binding response OmpR family regulator